MNLRNERKKSNYKNIIIFILFLIFTVFLILKLIENKSLQNDLQKISIENNLLRDSIKNKEIQNKVLSSEFNILNNQFKKEKAEWLEKEIILKRNLAEKNQKIAELIRERNLINSKRNKLQALINQGLEELSLGQIQALKKQVKRQEQALLNKNQKLYEYQQAKNILIENLEKANQRFKNNQDFNAEIFGLLIDFYALMREIDTSSFSLKEFAEKFVNNNNKIPEHTKNIIDRKKTFIIGESLKASIATNEVYGGSSFLNEISSRIKNIKIQFENIQRKESKIIEIIKKYDPSLSPTSRTIINQISQILVKAKQQKKEIEIYQEKLVNYEAELRIRYLYISSTEELRQQKILLRRDWRKPRAKRKIDLAKITSENCSIIDYENDLIIKIPDARRFRAIITPHEKWSFKVDTKTNTIYIKDRKKFWEISHYLVIETD